MQMDSRLKQSGKVAEEGEDAFVGLALAKARPLFTSGQLWHTFHRFADSGIPGEPQIDRLAQVLKMGLLPPASDEQRVVSDFGWHLKVTGSSVPYDSIVFIHRTIDDYLCTPGQIVVFLSDATPVTAPEDMPQPWLVLCLDEVYSLGPVRPEMIEGLMIIGPRGDAEDVVREFLPTLKVLAIPVYASDGEIIWPRVTLE